MKKKNSIYNQEKDILEGLTEDELLMISELADVPPPRTESVLKRHFEKSKSKIQFLERTDEIFLCYYRWGAFNINPFSFKQHIVLKVLEALDRIRSDQSPQQANLGDEPSDAAATFMNKSKKAKALLSLETSIKPFSKWNNLKRILIDEDVIGSHNELKLSGDGWKRRTIQLIDALSKKGYFEKRLNSYEVVAIIQNSFTVTVSREYVDKVINHGSPTDEFKFIPGSS